MDAVEERALSFSRTVNKTYKYNTVTAGQSHKDQFAA